MIRAILRAKAARIGHLGDEADVGERGLIAKAVYVRARKSRGEIP